MFDGCRLASFEAGLDHALLVVRARLAGVQIAEVNLNARDVFGEVGESMLHYLFGMADEGVVAVDAVVRPDLDMHAWSFPEILSVLATWRVRPPIAYMMSCVGESTSLK